MDVGEVHGEKLISRVAVAMDRCVVDFEEGETLRVVDPHRVRVLCEQETVAIL